MKMGVLGWVSWVLLVVGGLNWGLVGTLDFNLVTAIFGAGSIASSVVYVLVGLSAVWTVLSAFLIKKR